MENQEMLTPEEVCEMLGGVTTKTLRGWNAHHKYRKILAPIRFTNKHVRYERANVLAFIEKCRSDT